MKQRVLTWALAAVCLLGCCAVPALAAEEGGLENFRRGRTYTDGQFSDVAPDAWYVSGVAAAYEYGLIEGNPDGTYDPEGSVTLAQTIRLAASIHSIYHTGADNIPLGETVWYQTYVDYALEHGILTEAPDNCDTAARRRDFAVLLARALPESALPARNQVADGQIYDVPAASDGAAEIYRLYRAGILRGNDEFGTFKPNSKVARSEVAAILSRLASRSLRIKFTLAERTAPPYPDLLPQARAEDEFFADAAMLGNSMVDGMMLYAELPMNYYGGTGLTVFNSKIPLLLQRTYGKVYIELGINELGGDMEAFVAGYRRIITRIQEAMPAAEIYVVSLTPVTEKKNNESFFTMERIAEVNDLLYALAEEMNCWYIDCFTSLCDESGFLPEEWGGWDGSPHLDPKGYQAWAEVIRTYYVP